VVIGILNLKNIYNMAQVTINGQVMTVRAHSFGDSCDWSLNNYAIMGSNGMTEQQICAHLETHGYLITKSGKAVFLNDPNWKPINAPTAEDANAVAVAAKPKTAVTIRPIARLTAAEMEAAA
jgi:hypothetical protein